MVSLMMMSHQFRRHCLVPSALFAGLSDNALGMFSTIWCALTGRSKSESLASLYSPKVDSITRRTANMATPAATVVEASSETVRADASRRRRAG